ncbi:unnamed protein product, partial [marine sediment metagenome]
KLGRFARKDGTPINKPPYWLGKHRSKDTRKKIRKKLKGRKGKPCSEEKRKKIGEKNKINTKKLWENPEYRKNMIEVHIGKNAGENAWNWKGVTPLNKLLRCGSKWKIWRELVFLRDNFTCQNPNCPYCHNKIGVLLHPHHIKPLALYPELVFDINNGITYCAEFHIKSGLHKSIQEELLHKNIQKDLNN